MDTSLAKNRLVVFWTIWAGILGNAVYIRYSLPPNGEDIAGQTAFWLFYAIPVAISLVVRWLVLPRVQASQPYLISMIVGLAFSEGLTFFGLFLFPSKLDLFFYTSAVLMFIYIPMGAYRVLKKAEL